MPAELVPGAAPERPPAALLGGFFGLSAAVLVLEVVESRIFAFSLWYHLAFMVISIAMLGLAAAGSLLTTRIDWFRSRSRLALAGSGAGFALTLVAGHLIIARLFLTLSWWLVPGMGLLYLLVFLPFACAGVGLTLPFRLYSSASARLYLASMAGSGLGAAAALKGLSLLGAERMVVLAGLIGLASGLLMALGPVSRRVQAGATAGFALLAGVFFAAPQIMAFSPFGAKMMALYLHRNPAARVEATGWTPYCRIDVVDPGPDQPVFGHPYPAKIVFQDGDEPTSILQVTPDTDLHNLADLSFYGAGYLAVPHPQKLLIIGPGGGLEVHFARHHQVPDITAVELNPFTIAQVKGPQAAWTSDVYRQPGVHLINSEGRSFLARSRERYDLIILSGVDTYTSLISGAYVYWEGYLYTVEAMASYLDHLSDDGVIAFYRLQQKPPREDLRLVAMMVEALRRGGAAHPEDHIVIIEQQFAFSLLVKKSPFTATELAELRRQVNAPDYNLRLYDPSSGLDLPHMERTVMFAPDQHGADNYSQYLLAERAGAGPRFIHDYKFDLSLITDDSPYFFNVPLTKILNYPSVLQFTMGMMLFQILLSAVLAVLLVLWPLRRLPPARAPRGPAARLLAYFTAVGAGYLLVEIVVMQKLVLFLGNPAYSLTVTLSALLVASGLGALGWERSGMKISGRTAAAIAAVTVLAWLLLAPLALRPLMGLSAPARIAAACLLVLPLGLVMGVPFPAGLAAAARTYPDLVPWGMAANNAASVMASIVSVPLSMSFNFTTILVVAAVLYLAAASAGAFTARARAA